MRRTFSFAALIALCALALLRALDPPPVAALREAYFDTLQRLAPRQPANLPVRVVDIDDRSLQALGQWPWPRDRMADLTDRLTDLGAAAIVYDVIFSEPDRLSPARILDGSDVESVIGPDAAAELAAIDHDKQFADALYRAPSILSIAASEAENPSPAAGAGFVSVGPDPAGLLPDMPTATPILPALQGSVLGLGVLNVSPEGIDATVRRVPLVWQGANGPLPGLAVEGLRVALGEGTYVLVGLPDVPGMEALRIGEFEVPTNEKGEIRVRYRPYDPDMFVPAVDILDEDIGPEIADRLAGHIVFVGTSAAGLLDIRATPLGENVPGVSIHAQIVEQILTSDYLLRSDLIAGAEIAALLATGLVVTGVMAFGGAAASVVAGSVAAVLVLSLSWFGFVRSGVLFDATFPLLGGFAAFSVLAMFQYIVTDREKRMIRRSFSKYVAEDVLAEIERRGHSLDLGGEIREVTVLFSDIRDFTPLSESMPPHDLVELLNTLFSELTDRIQARRGTIDKYIGDSIMAFWNAPIETPDHARLACLAALDMREALAEFNAGRVADNGRPVEVTLGLASGDACVGNIGSRARYNYSVIGDTVNRSARIESNCRRVDYDVLVSSEVADDVGDLAVLDAGQLDLKGISDRTAVSIVVGGPDMAVSQEFLRLTELHAVLLEALANGQDHHSHLEACRQSGALLEPGLARFYAAIPSRLEDFARSDNHEGT